MNIAITVALLLFALTTKSCFFGVANAENSAVLDSDGDELRTGVPYYVVSALWDLGGIGGLALGRRSEDKTCPAIVVQLQSFFNIDFGTPVIFTNAYGDDDVVLLSTDLFIEFVPGIDLLCASSTVWKIDDEEYIKDREANVWVTTDGVKGKPAPETLESMFKIEKAGSHYKFYYCPSGCDQCGASLCDDIDRQSDGKQIRLALGDFGWPWEFRKANNTNMIKQVVNV